MPSLNIQGISFALVFREEKRYKDTNMCNKKIIRNVLNMTNEGIRKHAKDCNCMTVVIIQNTI